MRPVTNLRLVKGASVAPPVEPAPPLDPARIDAILGRLRRIWLMHPELRLGQILFTVDPMFGALTPDDTWVPALDAFIARYCEKP